MHGGSAATGLRATVGGDDGPDRWYPWLRETTAASLAESDALCRWHGYSQGRIRYAYAPASAPRTMPN